MSTIFLVLSPGFEPDLLDPQSSVLTANTNSAWRNDWESNPVNQKRFYRLAICCITILPPFHIGAPERTQTPNLLVRSQMLYSVELRKQLVGVLGIEPNMLLSDGVTVRCLTLRRHTHWLSQEVSILRLYLIRVLLYL